MWGPENIRFRRRSRPASQTILTNPIATPPNDFDSVVALDLTTGAIKPIFYTARFLSGSAKKICAERRGTTFSDFGVGSCARSATEHRGCLNRPFACNFSKTRALRSPAGEPDRRRGARPEPETSRGAHIPQ